jgi:uncharacterized protein YjbI with pentapeptide repeats
MACQNQLEILKQGVETWNTWRKKHPDEKIDLYGANLKGRDNLSGANFQHADIRGTSFKDATLKGCDFTHAKAGQTRRKKFDNFLSTLAWGGGMGLLLYSATIIYTKLFADWNTGFFSFNAHLLLLLGLSLGCTGTIVIGIQISRVAIVSGWAMTLGLFLPAIAALMIIDDVAIISTFLNSFLALVATVSATFGFSLVAAHTWKSTVIIILVFVYGAIVTDVEIGTNLWVFIVNIFIISNYIGWRVRCEDPQFHNLRRARLMMDTKAGTDFAKAILTGSIFDEACLKNTRFTRADLNGVSWKQATYLHLASFGGTILNDRDIRELLTHGNGQGLSLRGKKLSGANLSGSNLKNIDLREAELIRTNLSQADITGAKLYGISREDWIINDIQCDYVFWDEAGKKRTPSERPFRNAEGDRRGEFEELYEQIPEIEYYFIDGFTAVDAVVMTKVVETINQQNEDYDLKLDSLHARGQPHAKFTIRHKKDAGDALKLIRKLHEDIMIALGPQKDRIDQLLDVIGSGDVMNVYINKGQVGAMGDGSQATGNTFEQLIESEEK